MNPTQFFKCLSDESRLKSVLLIHQFNEACVCELMEALAMDQPKTSRHLASLRKCNILLDERRGKWVYYRLHPELPQWAYEVIAKTAAGTDSFISNAAVKFKQCQIKRNDCC
ncbi:metalloregulator ArsR/SmtB family transcription factor [Alteromonas sp. C1M14]|uniref:metalloregulator ArsR/SmtB family transcription factor n=1 Tax=Alteromonas sp. C1M14 TaxID=2841567 RepID=UPI001C0A3AFF|nr:metalloregulator ArsR/SmtB family transcription factor [Alteromonas sp. C1M14]MBU2979786.1 metalloregulator ArsR/SmtB family transcription factor [Alteromonas sp. C1M14]